MQNKERLLLPLFLMVINTVMPLVAQEKPQFKIGGTLRFNYSYSDWKPESRKHGGEFSYDVLRINLDAAYKKFLLEADYRFYSSESGGGMLKSGWIGYKFNDTHQLQFGLTTVPFGIMPYTGNNYFFNVNFYVGLEDDADMGIKYLFRKDGWGIDLAYFHNAELSNFGKNSEVSPERYAYDIAGRNKEVCQGNIRMAYNFGNIWKQQVGLSALLGSMYNMDTRRNGVRYAFALHYTVNYKHWNFNIQYANYKIYPKCPTKEEESTVVMAAYGSSYSIVSKADIYTTSLSYTIPIGHKFLETICLYNDFSLLHKRIANFNDSYQNVSGCSLKMGKVFTCIDYAVGKNHAWFGDIWDDAFAKGNANRKGRRFNINIGYYF